MERVVCSPLLLGLSGRLWEVAGGVGRFWELLGEASRQFRVKNREIGFPVAKE